MLIQTFKFYKTRWNFKDKTKKSTFQLLILKQESPHMTLNTIEQYKETIIIAINEQIIHIYLNRKTSI